VLGLVGLTPELVDAVTELAVADDGTVMHRRGPGLGEHARRSQRSDTTGKEGTTGERRHLKKMTDGG
jgi:hypothetical protein